MGYVQPGRESGHYYGDVRLLELLTEVRNELRRNRTPTPLQGTAKDAADKFAQIVISLGGPRPPENASNASDKRRENV